MTRVRARRHGPVAGARRPGAPAGDSKRLEKNGVDHAVDGRVGPDAETDRARGNRGEPGVGGQLATGAADVVFAAGEPGRYHTDGILAASHQ